MPGSPAWPSHPNWFEDGSIVLQVENTLYRVHRSRLESLSTVFRDTFCIPQPTEACHTIEGCPVLQLHDQSADFTRFLKAFDNRGFFPDCPVSGFTELNAVLELSEKYDVPLIRDSMVKILCHLYPCSLDKWFITKPFTLPGYDATIHDHISVLNLAVKMNIRSILPAVMYAICMAFEPEAIMFGKTKCQILNSDYRMRCVVGMTRLTTAKRAALKYLARDETNRCRPSRPQDVGACDVERLRWMSADLKADVADPLSDHRRNTWEYSALCSKCRAAAKASYADARRKLWEDLPSIFGLGSWDELLS
ncbi:hypothetical protein C8R43DRAFT_1238981 [Mycena crocata]|nr:hypothetical protein C8R43DRAFT_1238981 [Mycena crocata]